MHPLSKFISINMNRLLSLDILRGLDLFLLVGLQPIIISVLNQFEPNCVISFLSEQFDHAKWEGFTMWDLVMPLFLFMSGVTLPFSLPKYLSQNTNKKLWFRVIKRVMVLFVLGMIVQGNVLSLDFNQIYIYSNTLQAIAIGYLIAVPITVYFKPKAQVAIIILMLILYTVPMCIFGDWTPSGNFACKVDKLILGRFRDGSYLDINGDWQFAQWYDYTWIWSSITFGCTVAMGSLAGAIIRYNGMSSNRRVLLLISVGTLLIIIGYIWGMWHPIIKRIWTGSMVLYSGGWCYVLLGVFYWLIDVKKRNRGLCWLQFYGCNAIAAYLIGEIVNFRSVAHSLLYGTEQYLGNWYSAVLTLSNSLIIFAILALLYRSKKFFKV